MTRSTAFWENPLQDSIGSIVGNIVGSWRLVMTRAHDDAGEPMHAPYGPKPMGVVVFSADGRMIAVLCDGRPQLPDDEPDREYSSYCGTYSFDGTTLVTRVDAASDPRRLGGDQDPPHPLRWRPLGPDAATTAVAGRHAAPGDVLRTDRVIILLSHVIALPRRALVALTSSSSTT